MRLQRFDNVAFGQWRGATLLLHIGSTAWVLITHRHYGYPWGIEICTPQRWLCVRPFSCLTCRRG